MPSDGAHNQGIKKVNFKTFQKKVKIFGQNGDF